MKGGISAMTNKERVEALLRYEKVDRVPIYPFGGSFSMLYSGHALAELFNNPELSFESQRKAAKDFDWVFLPDLAYAAFGGWEFGGQIKWPDKEFDQAPTIIHYPAKSIAS